MPGILFSLPKVTPFSAGVVVPGAKLTFSQTGTSTPQNVYTDAALAVAHSSPVVADSAGVFAPIYLDPSLPDYRVLLTDANDTTIYQVDDVPAGTEKSLNYAVEDTAPYVLWTETDAADNNKNWRLIASGEQLILQVGNDDLDTFATVFAVDRTTNTVDTFNIAATDLQWNGTSIIATGTFTGTPTGGTSPSATTIHYILRADGSVTLTPDSTVSITSTSTAYTVTGLPAALQPTAAGAKVPVIVTDGNALPTNFKMGMASLTNSDTITFYLGDPLSATGFTASDIKGWVIGASITYSTQ